jgi:uncharacterized membrane protein YciS (DUF1049 family)
MRLLVILMTLLLFFVILGFLLTNMGTQVPVKVWTTDFPDVRLHNIVLISIFAGIVYASVIAIAEGAKIRIANRKLNREIHRLETELNYLRTQPGPRTEPDALAATPVASVAAREPLDSLAEVHPSAPVYGSEDSSDPEDDAYSGGRAV